MMAHLQNGGKSQMAEATPTVEAASTKLSDVKEAAKSKNAVKRETEARKRKTQSKLPIAPFAHCSRCSLCVP